MRSRALLRPRDAAFSWASSACSTWTSRRRRWKSASLPAVVCSSGCSVISVPSWGLGHGGQRTDRTPLPVCEAGAMSYSDLDRPPLDARALKAALMSPGSFWTDVVVTPSTASTNADLAEAARAGAAEGSIHTTDHQVAGRGRLDRTWESPEGSGIAVSVLLRPTEVPAGRWVWLPLLVGLAVAATVEECGVEARLKWPNDAEIDGRKIAGILLERVDTPDGPAAVVGVGLNVSLACRGAADVDTATSLLLEDADRDRSDRGPAAPAPQPRGALPGLARCRWRPGGRCARLVPAALRDDRLRGQRRHARRLDAGRPRRGRRRPRVASWSAEPPSAQVTSPMSGPRTSGS